MEGLERGEYILLLTKLEYSVEEEGPALEGAD